MKTISRNITQANRYITSDNSNTANTLSNDSYLNDRKIVEDVFPESLPSIFENSDLVESATNQTISRMRLLTSLKADESSTAPLVVEGAQSYQDISSFSFASDKNRSFDLGGSFGWIGNKLSVSQNSPSQQLGCSCPACCGSSNNLNASSSHESTFPGSVLASGTPAPAAVSTGDYRLNALIAGTKWLGNTISYSFFDGGSYYGSERVGEVSNVVKNNVRYILENYIEPLVNVNFVEVFDGGNSYGQLRYMLSSGPEYAYARYPENSAIGGDVHLNPSYDNAFTSDGFQGGLGTHGFMTLVHESLHALGLKHPGNYNGGGTGEPPFLPYREDNTTNTVMSYNFAGNSASTLMPYDIKALQYLYGARSYNAGNTTYTFDTVFGFADGSRYWGSPTNRTKAAIWDSGGTDTLNFSRLAFNNSGYLFNLNQGGMLTTQSAYNGTSYRARGDASGTFYNTTTYGTAIAYGMTIENAIGSSSNDTIVGNGTANFLQGGSGNDFLSGGSGHDTLIGGSGNDRLVGYAGGTEYDVLAGGIGVDTFVLGNSSSTFYQGNDYARITDFDWRNDYIQVKGTSRQYSLQSGNWFGSSALDTAIFFGSDAVGVVQDSTNVNFTRDFVFA